MAVRVDSTKELVLESLEALLASRKRAQNTTKNPKFRELYTVDVQHIQAAIGSVTETK